MAKKIKKKSHSGLSKVLKIRKGGSVKYQPANKLHQTRNRSNASGRNRHHEHELSNSDYKRIKSIMK